MAFCDFPLSTLGGERVKFKKQTVSRVSIDSAGTLVEFTTCSIKTRVTNALVYFQITTRIMRLTFRRSKSIAVERECNTYLFQRFKIILTGSGRFYFYGTGMATGRKCVWDVTAIRMAAYGPYNRKARQSGRHVDLREKQCKFKTAGKIAFKCQNFIRIKIMLR